MLRLVLEWFHYKPLGGSTGSSYCRGHNGSSIKLPGGDQRDYISREQK